MGLLNHYQNPDDNLKWRRFVQFCSLCITYQDRYAICR